MSESTRLAQSTLCGTPSIARHNMIISSRSRMMQSVYCNQLGMMQIQSTCDRKTVELLVPCTRLKHCYYFLFRECGFPLCDSRVERLLQSSSHCSYNSNRDPFIERRVCSTEKERGRNALMLVEGRRCMKNQQIRSMQDMEIDRQGQCKT